MNILFRCFGIAIISALTAVILKKNVPEISVFIVALASLFIIFQCLSPINEIIASIKTVSERVGLEEYSLVLLKSLGITVITKISGDICRDCGQNGLASATEIIGSSILMLISLPVFNNIISFLEKLLGI